MALIRISSTSALTFAPNNLSLEVGDGGGFKSVAGLRLFAIYNQAYRLRFFVADGIEQAVDLAFAAGHMRKRHVFRRAVDCTGEVVKLADVTIPVSEHKKVIAEGIPSLVDYQPGVGWVRVN